MNRSTSFYSIVEHYRSFDVPAFVADVDERRVERALSRRSPDEMDLLCLLSPAAASRLEGLAQQAHRSTTRHFGAAVQLFTPLYISNYCDNCCRYCSFAHQYPITRRHLSVAEISAEAGAISATGMRHILLLTGESRERASPEYLRQAVAACREHFASIAMEVYPLSRDEYSSLVAEGADGLTIYQEVYEEGRYRELHEGGPKADYRFRLEAPERGCEAGMHRVTVGSLLGLAPWLREAFLTALHLTHLQHRFPGVELSVSLPRLRPLVAEFVAEDAVNDRQFVQLLCALRICFPTVGITVSTRESRRFRDAILPMGVTRMSAGVSTAVGGHGEQPSTSQFEIADNRDLQQMKADLLRLGYQPVMHDWSHRLQSTGT